MKKIILFFITAFFLVGCKQDNNSKKDVKERVFPVVSGSCQTGADIIIVDYSLLPEDENEYNQWLDLNRSAICMTKNNKDIYIDLGKIDFPDSQEVANWLEENGQYINFEESYIQIEKVHKIENATNLQGLSDYYPITFYNIKTAIGRNANFDNDHYNKYVKFEKDGSGNYQISIVDDFAPDCSCFSIPFFRSIEKNITHGTDPVFEFNKAVLHTNEDPSVFFRVNGNYYNYTRVPKGF